MAPNLPDFQGIKSCVQYLASNPHKPIFYLSNYYYGSNIISLTCSENQVEDHTTQNCLECHQDVHHARIINIRLSVLGIINNLIGVAFCWKLHIQPAIASDSTTGEIRSMLKSVEKNKVIRRYMKALEIHTVAPTFNWEGNTISISIVESKKVAPRVKHIDITVYFLQEQFDKWSFSSRI